MLLSTGDTESLRELKFLRRVSENTMNSDEEFIKMLKGQVPGLKEVSTVEDCDFILFFCPIVSRAGTDIEAALQKLQRLSDTKPAVLVVLHHTFNPDITLPEGSRSVNRENTLTVDCVFHEDRGLLQCPRNQDAGDKVSQWINLLEKAVDESEREVGEYSWNWWPFFGYSRELKFLRGVSENTLNSDEDFIKKLKEQVPDLKEVSEVQECDFILFFCPIVSRAGTDIEAALQKLQRLSDTKPAVLVVLHPTFDPYIILEDSSRSVNRENALTVDCVFYEDRGLLQCPRNQDAGDKVSQWIKPLAINQSTDLPLFITYLWSTGQEYILNPLLNFFNWIIQRISALTAEGPERDELINKVRQLQSKLQENGRGEELNEIMDILVKHPENQ
ncbi:uncharacterized protein [Hoplias malabaricus]